NGSNDAAHRATKIYQQRLESYEKPPLDEAIDAEMREYVSRRRKELGD
ncbi:MAG: trimethylamine methyltransferase, partial [Marmoricola sp.]|nr:trimethylamine methyltransferase [Marmoricola sp.]